MSNFKQTTVAAFVGAMALGLTTQLPAHSEQIPYCQKVNYAIGLNIRSAPRSDSRRRSSVAYGQKVFLAGTLKRSGTGSVTVIPTVAKDSQGTTWVKIKAPVSGWVLFATGGDTDSLVSCQQ
ncbi:MAG: hypothetical protein KME08_12225 [Aphanothece sp. CMT-3BRIN-NPC111]|jgi:hypothetical protein|nr:hypothetical protein [Aphanothece sp. CMT-3BRIN-NPC111]